MKLNKTVIALLVVGILVLLWGFSTYNSLVSKDEGVSTAWSDIEAQYQRRNDLIPNLVNTVKGYAKHEQSTLQGVVEARAKATQMTIDPDNLTPEKLKAFQQAQGQVATALGRLLAVSENYPELKANENFLTLQDQLEGTENRINESRKKYNATVQEYNLSVRRFPGNIVAGLFGFEKKTKFEAEAGAEKAPKVSFD